MIDTLQVAVSQGAVAPQRVAQAERLLRRWSWRQRPLVQAHAEACRRMRCTTTERLPEGLTIS
jgi:hypothetical protein